MNIREPKEKDFTLTAYVKFNDPFVAQEAANHLSCLSLDGSDLLEINFEMKTSFFVSKFMFNLIEKEIERTGHALETEGSWLDIYKLKVVSYVTQGVIIFVSRLFNVV